MDVFIDARFAPVFARHPLVLADVGARGGLKKNWQAARRHLRLVGFEPDKHEFDRLAAAAAAGPHGDRYFNVALHNRRGQVSLHVARDAGLSSIFEPNRAFLDAFPDAARFDIVDRRDVATDTLAAVLRDSGGADLDFIKVDTQGSELAVLEGAREALASAVVGVEAEVEFAPIYAGQPLFADVDAYLRGLGFALFDLRPCFWKREAGRDLGGPHGQIIWSDALYFKTAPALAELVSARPEHERAAKVLHALSVALLYGYVDYAIEIARQFRALWTADEAAAIERALATQGARDGGPRLPGRRRLASALRKLEQRVDEPAQGWSISDAELGNLE